MPSHEGILSQERVTQTLDWGRPVRLHPGFDKVESGVKSAAAFFCPECTLPWGLALFAHAMKGALGTNALATGSDRDRIIGLECN